MPILFHLYRFSMGITMPDYFNELYNGLKQTFEREARCVVDEASDIDIRFRAISAEFASIYDKMDFYERQIYPNTAEGDYLKRHGAVRGVIRKGASRSTGFVSFSRKLPSPQSAFIPKGTKVTSSKLSDTVFETTIDYTIPANVATGVIPVQARILGERGIVAAGFVDVLVEPVANIISVTNEEKISGGSGIESDELFKQRVIESYSKINNGVNLNYYEQFAKSQPDIWYAKAAFNGTNSNQIDLYVENFERTISDAAIAELQTAAQEARELGIGVVVKRPARKRIDVTIKAKVDNMANEVSYSTHIQAAIDQQIKNFAIGQAFSPALMINSILPHMGIMDLVLVTPLSPVTIQQGEICYPGQHTITIEKWGG